jgi:hypothetical protein
MISKTTHHRTISGDRHLASLTLAAAHLNAESASATKRVEYAEGRAVTVRSCLYTLIFVLFVLAGRSLTALCTIAFLVDRHCGPDFGHCCALSSF